MANEATLPEGYREQAGGKISPGSRPFLEKFNPAFGEWIGICSLLPGASGVYLGRHDLTHEDILAIGIWLQLHSDYTK